MSAVLEKDQQYIKFLHHQPCINVGMIGHVADGKSTIVQCLTGVATQKFSSEKVRNITYRLGYANCKIWICDNCDKPECYSSSGSGVMEKKCEHCSSELRLATHISFVDCPGHNMLTTTMLNGSSVMDYTVLVESSTNETIPAPQTAEHFMATQAANIPTSILVMNKIDIAKRDDVITKIGKMNKFIGEKIKNVPPVIPISATFGVNIDVLCEYLANLPVPESRNPQGKFKMIVIRSFDVNKPGCDITNLHGGVIGGSIMRGTLKVGDNINIYPGIYTRVPEGEKKEHGADFKYHCISGTVLSINSDKNDLESAVPGGLLGIQLTIDPAYTRNDLMTGSLVLRKEDVEKDTNMCKVYDKIIIEMRDFMIDESSIMQHFEADSSIKINVNSNNVDCKVLKYSRKRKELRVFLKKPIAVDTDVNYVTVMAKGKDNDNIGRGVIIDGVECEKY